MRLFAALGGGVITALSYPMMAFYLRIHLTPWQPISLMTFTIVVMTAGSIVVGQYVSHHDSMPTRIAHATLCNGSLAFLLLTSQTLFTWVEQDIPSIKAMIEHIEESVLLAITLVGATIPGALWYEFVVNRK